MVDEEEIIKFRETLCRIYREQPPNDEGSPADPSTVFLLIEEFDKHFHYVDFAKK